MKKNHLLKESLIATIIVLLVTYLISFFPISLEYYKALHQGFADFDIYDLYYSGKDKENTNRDKNIILVQIGEDRSEIADQINLISSCNPKAIAIDAFFEEGSDDDSKFRQAINQKSNLIFTNVYTNKGIASNFFYNDTDRCGYGNFIGNKYSVIRTFYPRIKINGKQYYAFAPTIARLTNPEKFNTLEGRCNEQEIIRYKGSLESYTNFSANELKLYDSSGELENIIKNKTVLLGFFVKDTSHLILDDLHFTPLNERVSGKSFPDMYGVVIHANILSMILNGKYPTLASTGVTYLFAFLISFLFNFYILSRHQKKEHPSHGLLLLVQLCAILFIMYFFLNLYTWFLFKVPLEPIMICMVLSLEWFGLYESFALLAHKKFHYQTVFYHKHIT